MRWSLVGSIGSFGSLYASRLPLPLVSRMNGVQPCAFCSSPVCVEDERRPALRLLLVARLEIDARVEPPLHRTAARVPEHVVLVEERPCTRARRSCRSSDGAC